MNSSSITALFLGLLTLAGGVCAENITANRENGRKLSGQCRTCHGANGYAQIPIAPHIGGEPENYLRTQLTAFREGTRQHEMMSIVARTLSDQNIADLVAWYAGHRVNVEMKADPNDAPARCIECHGRDGIHLSADVPNLAGESNIYIDTQLKAFRSGKRVSEVMSAVASELSDQEIRAVANWYANIDISIETVD